MNLSEKQKRGITIGAVVWAILQIIFNTIKINNVSDYITIGIMTAGTIIFIVVLNVDKNKIEPKAKIMLSILPLIACIFTSVSILISDMNIQQFKYYKILSLIIFILALFSFFAFILYICILFVRMIKKNAK